MDLKRLIPIAVMIFAAACSPTPIKKQQEKSYFSNFALAICLGSAFDDDSVKSDFNKAANGYMERGNMPIEAINEMRGLVDSWLKKDYPSKHGGQVNSAKCFDFYHSEELAQLFKKYDPCKSEKGWLSKEDFNKACL